MVKERVIAWFRKAVASKSSPRLPSNIIFYRDGVSESQFAMVDKVEKSQIMEGWTNALGSLLQDPNNQITPQEKDRAPKLVFSSSSKDTRLASTTMVKIKATLISRAGPLFILQWFS